LVAWVGFHFYTTPLLLRLVGAEGFEPPTSSV
jgi:hypothetical protein